MKKTALEAALEAIDSFLEIRAPLSGIPGISLTIAKKGKILFEKGYGYAHLAKKKALTPHSLFRIASHSKMFTASCLARLVEAGRVDFHDRVVDVLPELRTARDKRFSHITFHHLLSHTAGVLRDGDHGNFWSLGAPFPSREELLDDILASRLYITPGRMVKYSNHGYGLLGLALERITGKSFDETLREEVLEPLGLENTFSDRADSRRADIVQAYCGESYGVALKEVEDIPTFALAAATGLTSNGTDVSKFLWAHDPSHSRYLKASTKKFLLQRVGPMKGSPDGVEYARGFFRLRQGRHDFFGHSGGFTGQITYSLFDLRSQLSISVMTNCIERRAAPIMRAVIEFLDFFLKRYSPDKRGKESQAFRGTWSNVWYTVRAEPLGAGKVALYYPLTGWEGISTPSILSVEDKQTLRFIEEGSSGWANQEVRFSHKSSSGFSRVKIGSDELVPLAEFQSQLAKTRRIEVPKAKRRK